MTRKLSLTLLALAGRAPARRDRRARRDGRDGGRPGRHADVRPPRRHGADDGLAIRVLVHRARREGVLRLRRLEGWRERPPDRLHVPGRPLRPDADRPADEAARREGRGVRDLQHVRHRPEPRRPRLPQPEEGAAALRRLRRDDARLRGRPVPVHDRPPAHPHRRGVGARPVPRAHAGRGQGRRPLREQRLWAGASHRPPARRPPLEGEARLHPGLRRRRDRRSDAGRAPAGVRRERLRRLRELRNSRPRR